MASGVFFGNNVFVGVAVVAVLVTIAVVKVGDVRVVIGDSGVGVGVSRR